MLNPKISEKLSELNQLILEDKNPPEAVVDIFRSKYRKAYSVKDEFTQIYSVLELFCYTSLQSGVLSNKIRSKLLQLLSFYFVEGNCNRDTRQKAASLFNVKDETINSLNHTLRKLRLIVQNEMRTGDDKLNEGLQRLRDYYYKRPKGEPFIFQINISIE